MWLGHIFDYLLILTTAFFFIIAMKLFKGERSAQIMLVISFAGFYMLWGIYHHIITKTLRIKIILEYMLVGTAIIFFLLTIAMS
jgi:hypothetical protein